MASGIVTTSTMLGVVLTSLILGLPAATSALNCSGPLDLVVAVPVGLGVMSDAEWGLVEPFLERVVDVLDTETESQLRLGLVLYGPRPLALAGLEPWLTPQGMRARATLLSQRHLHVSSLGYGPGVPLSSPPSLTLALEALHDVMAKNRRPEAKQVGIVMTMGANDTSSSDPSEVQAAIARAAAQVRGDNIALLAVSTRGTVPGFVNITNDYCRLFSLGSYSGLVPSLLPYLTSTVCYVQDPTVNPPTPVGRCFPELVEVPPIRYPTAEELGCTGLTLLREDPRNCAYYNLCTWNPRGDPWLLRLQPCPPATLYDPNERRCEHKDSVTCYSGLTCPQPFGLFAHPRACHLFLNCSGGGPNVQSCPEGLWFDSRTKLCQTPSDSDCSVPGSTAGSS